MSKTDHLGLEEQKIFKVVREGLPKDLPLPLNVLAVKDGVLFTWDFANSCVLSLNIKAARSKDGDNVSHQSLLPLSPVSFRPEFITTNENGTLLLVGGPCGVLVMELPMRYPPYGAFDHNKEVVYCKSYSLDERLLLCSETVKVRQAKFHPGSSKTTHILVLTTDNFLRLYNIENGKALSLRSYQIGVQPTGRFPGSKLSLSDSFGEVGIDFDFGHPDLMTPSKTHPSQSPLSEGKQFYDGMDDEKQPPQQREQPILMWPVYVLTGDGNVYVIHIPLHGKSKHAVLKGPICRNSAFDNGIDFCSIICLNTNPQVMCIGHVSGTIYHAILIPTTEHEFEAIRSRNTAAANLELLYFEKVQLELEVESDPKQTWPECSLEYSRPMYLHKDEYVQSGRYYVSHKAGVHAVSINCLQDLQDFITGSNDHAPLAEIFTNVSTVEYTICTRTPTSKVNSVLGFALYYDPPSVLALLSDGHVVSWPVQLTPNFTAPQLEEGDHRAADGGEIPDLLKSELENSPMKVMLRESIEMKIQNMLKSSAGQYPKLKLGNSGEPTARERYELMEKVGKIYRNVHLKNIQQVMSELLRRGKAMRMMFEHQMRTMDQLNVEKQMLQEKAESLAEKYEDIKDKQDVVAKRCERLLQLVSQKKSEPSDAEKDFIRELGMQKEKMDAYSKSIEKLKMKVKYQKLQMENWKTQTTKYSTGLTDRHTETISANLKEMSQKIQTMVKEVHEYKDRLNLK